jgi:hypothetical protein
MKPIYSKSFENFLETSQNKVAKVLTSINYKYKYRYSYISNIVTTEEINHITFRKNGMLSYLPAGKEHKLTEDGEWSRDGRQEGKPAKVIKKLFTERGLKLFKEIDFEQFANEYKSNYLDDNYKLELLSSTEIKRVYDMERRESGSLKGSCMNDKSMFLDIYEYCDKLEVLILTDKEGKLCGRALIWDCDDFKLMDRIYVSDDHMYNTFINYATENKLWRKKDYKSYSNKRTFIDSNGEEVTKTLTIKLNTDFDYYPYIDTFTYGDDGVLSNQGGEHEYTHTDGTREENNRFYDEIDGEYIDECDVAYIDSGEGRYIGLTTHVDNTITDVRGNVYYNDDINIVAVNGEYYDINNGEVCEVDGEYYLEEECCYSDLDGSYYLIDDCTYIDSLDSYVLTNEVYKVNGTYYHESQVEKL